MGRRTKNLTYILMIGSKLMNNEKYFAHLPCLIYYDTVAKNEVYWLKD